MKTVKTTVTILILISLTASVTLAGPQGRGSKKDGKGEFSRDGCYKDPDFDSDGIQGSARRYSARKDRDKGEFEKRTGRDSERGRRHDRGRGAAGDHEEFMKWLKENHPDQAEKITSPEDRDNRMLRLYMKKYREIFRVSREDPEKAQLLEQDLDLRGKRRELMKRLSSTSDEQEREELSKELKDVLGSRYDLLLKRRQLAYDRLLEKLKTLQEEITASESKLEQWKDSEYKQDQIDQRIEQLLEKTETFKWEQ